MKNKDKLIRKYLQSFPKEKLEWEIHYNLVAFDVTDEERMLICYAIAFLPTRIQNKVLGRHCCFLGTSSGEASHFDLKKIKKRKFSSLIILSPGLVNKKSLYEKVSIILHEVGHFIHKDKSMTFDGISEEEDKKQEKEANKFANDVLSPIF